MGLTNAQYDAIIKDYDNTRMENRHILEKRREYVYSHVDGYKELDDSVISVSMESVKKKLAGDQTAMNELHSLLDELRSMKKSLLVGAGFSEDYLDDIYTCPDCKDTGYIGSEKCHCFIKQITNILYDQSNIREFLKENNFTKLSTEYYSGEDLDLFNSAVEKSKQLINNFSVEKSNLLFFGTVGTGKSFLSGCVAKELIDKGYSVIYYSSIGLFELLAKETFHTGSKDDLYNLYDYLYNCDLLIIDDLGTETTNSFISSQLFALINERKLRKKSTIISTNLSLQEIRDRYSDRIFSRFVNSFTVCKLAGKDIRIQKKTNK
ncbi:MAG: ATP-binding protein [Lachnospiraceae bacterium]|nr:ATP-binding protein [Lachnospiraceae bacterium]